MLPIDLHVHTMASGHAFCTLREVASSAGELGYSVIGITDHGPSMEGAATPGYFEMCERVPRSIGGVRILMGCELNILNSQGDVDLSVRCMSKQGILIAGLHARTPYPRYSSCQDNTRAIIEAMERFRIHVVSHPYRVRYPTNVEDLVNAACDCGTLLELNVSLFRSILRSTCDPSEHETVVHTRRMLDCLRREGASFVISSDAHEIGEMLVPRCFMVQLERLLGFSKNEAANKSVDSLDKVLPSVLE